MIEYKKEKKAVRKRGISEKEKSERVL